MLHRRRCQQVQGVWGEGEAGSSVLPVAPVADDVVGGRRGCGSAPEGGGSLSSEPSVRLPVGGEASAGIVDVAAVEVGGDGGVVDAEAGLGAAGGETRGGAGEEGILVLHLHVVQRTLGVEVPRPTHAAEQQQQRQPQQRQTQEPQSRPAQCRVADALERGL